MARRKGPGVEGLKVCRRRRDRRGPARRGAWIQSAAAARRVDRQDAAARFATGWNKKKLAELLTNRISLDIFGYIRGGNVPAPKNEDKTMANNKDVKTYDLELNIRQIEVWIKDLRDRQIISISIEKGLPIDGKTPVNMTIYKNGTQTTVKQVFQIIEDWATRIKEHAAASQK
jgi:hypothetical protein